MAYRRTRARRNVSSAKVRKLATTRHNAKLEKRLLGAPALNRTGNREAALRKGRTVHRKATKRRKPKSWLALLNPLKWATGKPRK